MIFVILILEKTFAYEDYYKIDMYWKSYGDGTFSYEPKEEPVEYTVKTGAWYQHENGDWSFYMSTDGGHIFTPIRGRKAYINFVDNPVYQLYTFDDNGIMRGGELINLSFPPPNTFFVNIYAHRISLKLQPGDICANEGTVINGGHRAPYLYQ